MCCLNTLHRIVCSCPSLLAYVVVTEVDKYSNTLFVSVAKSATIDVLAVDIGGGRQSLYKTIVTSNYQTSKEGDGNCTLYGVINYMF